MKFAFLLIVIALLPAISPAATASPAPAYIRVSQIGYESGRAPYRAFLMTTAEQTSGIFNVIDAGDHVVYSAAVGPLLGTWDNSASLAYKIYPLDFRVPTDGRYTLSIKGLATSPAFAVAGAASLYSGLLLNAKFFYESERDGANYIPNALRTAPAHLNDKKVNVYQTPPLDENDNINTTDVPLTPTGATINADGGWWDAGDYMKYVETISYTVALQEIGIRDFPSQMGPGAPLHPAAPPLAISYSGHFAGSPASPDFSSEAAFGIDFLLRMWDDKTRTLYYQVGNSQDWNNFDFLSDYDIWRLPQADDTWGGCDEPSTFICHRPAFVAGPAGSKISPNLAGRLAADFAVCYELNHGSNPSLANQCLKNAEDIFELADTSLADPANSVGSGTCSPGCLLTIIPFDGYPETVWEDDMELGATELYRALQLASKTGKLPDGLPQTHPRYYLAQAAHYAKGYIGNIYSQAGSDTLNLYDVSGLAHFELYKVLQTADNAGLEITSSGIRAQFLQQVNDAITTAKSDPWGFGASWSSDTTSHGAGISVMASEAYSITGQSSYNTYSQRWMANILGANAWGSSFIVGDGAKTFPNCIQHQVANIVGALNGTSGGTPILWGAASEGPAGYTTTGLLDGMLPCPANGADTFAQFNGNGSLYQDNVQSYSTTEPAIDLTATSFLMWSWRLAN